jgi:hypothetical protein
MPKTKISEFDTNPDNNTDINSINIAEGCPPSSINNAIRQLMADLKEFQTGGGGDPFNGAVNGTVGATTPNTGAFTTLSASSTVSGTGFSNYLASPPAIGSSAANTGAFTTLSASGAASFNGGVTLGDASGDALTINSSAVSIPNGLNFDSNTLVVDATNNSVGVGTAIPSSYDSKLSVLGNITMINTGNKFYPYYISSTNHAYLSSSAGGDLTFGTGLSGVSERMRIDSSGNVGIGTSSPTEKLHVSGIGLFGGTTPTVFVQPTTATNNALYRAVNTGGTAFIGLDSSAGGLTAAYALNIYHTGAYPITFATNGTERMRIDSGGNLYFAKSSSSVPTVGIEMITNGRLLVTSLDQDCLVLNRQSTDGILAEFRHANTTEGSISISGTTVSYNGGHLSRYAQTTTPKDDSLLKGTVLSNLDEMNQYVDVDGNPVENEQLNKVKVSDVEGDVNVAGVFVNWYFDEQHGVNEINMAMTGDMIIRIAQGVTVQRGDLLMSAGDGTAKPQGDDIVRSKTVAKVTSTHVTCTYADGSYCVPCVLMAC